MDSLIKALYCLRQLHDMALLPQSNRIELRMVRSGHWRLYFSLMPAQTGDQLQYTIEACRKCEMWPNLFPSSEYATALTIVDPAEHTKP